VNLRFVLVVTDVSLYKERYGVIRNYPQVQLAGEITPEGYWNPALTTAPVIKLFEEAK